MKLHLSRVLILIFLSLTVLLSGCVKTNPDDLNNPGNNSPIPTGIGEPLGDAMTKTIGPDGGTILSADGKAELSFPAGALTANTEISIRAISNNTPNGIGSAYRFLPEGMKFTQPVTVKFHYSASDLASTLADLMGIAFQDSVAVWNRVNNFTNDPANKIISASITHFSDWSAFDVIQITPDSALVKVSNTVSLTTSYVDPGSDEDAFTPIILKTLKINWSANGILNGNASMGTLSGNDFSTTYIAPSQLPSPNPVDVTGDVQITIKYHGKTYNHLQLSSIITVYDNKPEKYFLEVRITGTIAPLIYTDSVNMIITLNSDGTVTASNINNFAPKSTPATVTMGGCTSTWVPDGIGEINVTSVSGTTNISSGGASRDLYLNFTSTGPLAPTYTQQCDGGDPETEGGFPISGLPIFTAFTLVPGQWKYEQDSGDEYNRLTLIK